VTPGRWARLKEIFGEALEASEAERPRILEAACGGDAGLRMEVERMLAGNADGSWQSPAANLLTSCPALAPGDTVSHYTIKAKLGEGGMGVVYRAHDTRLGRSVALKFTNAGFGTGAEREARAVAALNHPNICTLHDVGPNYLVMELVEGPTLAERIQKGPIPLEEALAIARQIADGVAAAHDQGIVHRDLKPANIKVKPDGTVKVLDFGLARISSAEARDAHDSATTIAEAGVIVGTPAYMAPEQARGEPLDKRGDIWAFGCVLYEMLTASRVFGGETTSDILAAVIAKDPDLTRVPVKIRRLLRRCLEKNPTKRLRDIGDVWELLDDTAASGAAAGGFQWTKGPRAAWTAAAVLALVALAACWIAWRATRPVDRPLARLSVDLGPEAMMGANTTVAISPDGRRFVFPARGADGRQQLATRLLNQAELVLLPGTEGGLDAFFSPDGQWIGFFAGGQLKKISVQGGAPVSLTSVAATDTGIEGASWGDDGNIVTATGVFSPLVRVPAGGGPARPLTKLGPGEIAHRYPQVLPGANAVIFTASASISGMDSANIEAISLKTGQIKILHRGGYFGRYLPSGCLLYIHQGILFGVKFDPQRLEVRGAPVALLEDVAASAATGGGQFDFSATGTFVYSAGKSSAQVWRVGWLDRSGGMKPLLATPGTYTQPRFSPDGRKLSFTGEGQNIYIYDLERDTVSRLTSSGHANSAVWTPDGKHIAFELIAGVNGLYWVRSDGTGEPQRLLESTQNLGPWSFSPDGRRLAYFERVPGTGDLMTLPLDLADPDRPKAGEPEPFLRTPADELVPSFSPDGHWIAYQSNESGNREVYVRPFPAARRGKWQLSSGGATYAFWSKNGRELFYESVDNRIMVVDYAINGDSFVPAKPRVWLDKQLFSPGLLNLALAPDGQRFAVLHTPELAGGGKGSVHVTVLLNFFDEVKRRIP
jgi:Tol biopolymer transport system component